MTHVSGTQAALEQTLADLNEAGQQDTRMYRGIVAELARRKNENAPAPVAPGDEGHESNPHQEDGFSLTVHPTGFVRDVATFPTDEGTEFTVGAQFQCDEDGTEHRLIVLNGHYGIDVSLAPELLGAICDAAKMLIRKTATEV